MKVTPEILCNKLGISVNEIQNSAKKNCDIYETFSQQLVTDGEIHWYQHNIHLDTVVLSDYNPSILQLDHLLHRPMTMLHANQMRRTVIILI